MLEISFCGGLRLHLLNQDSKALIEGEGRRAGKREKLCICVCIGHSIKTSVCHFCVDENLKNPPLFLIQKPIDMLTDVWGKR